MSVGGSQVMVGFLAVLLCQATVNGQDFPSQDRREEGYRGNWRELEGYGWRDFVDLTSDGKAASMFFPSYGHVIYHLPS